MEEYDYSDDKHNGCGDDNEDEDANGDKNDTDDNCFQQSRWSSDLEPNEMA